MQEATLVKWLVKPGDQIKRGHVIGEVDTAKGVIDLECFQEGTVGKILVNAGETVPVGTAMLSLVSAEETLVEGSGEDISLSKKKPTEDQYRLVEHNDRRRLSQKPTVNLPRPKLMEQASAGKLEKNETAETPFDKSLSARVSTRLMASPLARRRAAELGIDLTTVATTRVDQTIGVEDVENAAKISSTVAKGKDPEHSREALRTAIAGAMAKSKSEIPHYYLQTSIDMQKALAWLNEENKKRSLKDRLLPAVLLTKAVASALAEVPQLNGYWLDGHLQQSKKIHVGFAIAMKGGGLVAPAIHDVDTKSLDQLMSDAQNLIPRARAGRMRSSEMSDATITITSLGDLGVETVFGIIYPPQVALVGFGKILDRPWVEAGQLCVRPVVSVSLSADHRATDGMVGARFLDSLEHVLQEPQLL
jgi:pyruvate dehydrogenase E2 component (dihydrolipoamide acetyltransferase)